MLGGLQQIGEVGSFGLRSISLQAPGWLVNGSGRTIMALATVLIVGPLCMVEEIRQVDLFKALYMYALENTCSWSTHASMGDPPLKILCYWVQLESAGVLGTGIALCLVAVVVYDSSRENLPAVKSQQLPTWGFSSLGKLASSWMKFFSSGCKLSSIVHFHSWGYKYKLDRPCVCTYMCLQGTSHKQYPFLASLSSISPSWCPSWGGCRQGRLEWK